MASLLNSVMGPSPNLIHVAVDPTRPHADSGWSLAISRRLRSLAIPRSLRSMSSRGVSKTSSIEDQPDHWPLYPDERSQHSRYRGVIAQPRLLQVPPLSRTCVLDSMVIIIFNAPQVAPLLPDYLGQLSLIHW